VGCSLSLAVERLTDEKHEDMLFPETNNFQGKADNTFTKVELSGIAQNITSSRVNDAATLGGGERCNEKKMANGVK